MLSELTYPPELYPFLCSIGYPVVTLGFGFNSYVSYKMRLRRQEVVQKENEFYMQLLLQALPPEQQMLQRQEREAEEGETHSTDAPDTVQVMLVKYVFNLTFILSFLTSTFHSAALAKGISEMDSTPVSQNGAPASKKMSAMLPELEYREKGKEGREAKKQHNSILPSSVDSKLQEIEYMENHMNNKRLTTELVGSTENLLLKEENSSSSSSSKNYKNSSGNAAVNSLPCGHCATNGCVQSAPSSFSWGKKQKCAAGKGPAVGSHRDPTDNCIPNNHLSKPEALVR